MVTILTHQLDFGGSSATDPGETAYSVPQTSYLDLRGLFLRRRGGEGKKKETGIVPSSKILNIPLGRKTGREKEVKERERRGREGRG